MKVIKGSFVKVFKPKKKFYVCYEYAVVAKYLELMKKVLNAYILVVQ